MFAVVVSFLLALVATLYGGAEAAYLRAAAPADLDRNLAEVGYGFVVSHISQGNRWCLTAAEGAMNDAHIRLRPCDFGGMPSNQMWSFDDDGRLHSLLDDSKCMVANHGDSFFNGLRPTDQFEQVQLGDWNH